VKFIGVTDGTISKLENGRNYPSMELAIKLADFFDVSLDELIGRSKL
jgi:DNA-binding XRE family transcriptional regulator